MVWIRMPTHQAALLAELVGCDEPEKGGVCVYDVAYPRMIGGGMDTVVAKVGTLAKLAANPAMLALMAQRICGKKVGNFCCAACVPVFVRIS